MLTDPPRGRPVVAHGRPVKEDEPDRSSTGISVPRRLFADIRRRIDRRQSGATASPPARTRFKVEKTPEALYVRVY
ncbi:MAG: hypothetical protein GVY13_00930 [Alphaproteobacteria bacterium]|jgi:hypothetical protein|nr:hypothetical protein [Alphaproteobacteria bacterium]